MYNMYTSLTSMKVYLWVHRQWGPIAITCANVSFCPFNFAVLQHIKLISPINTDVVCQEKCHQSSYIVVHCCPWSAILMRVIITFHVTFCSKTGCQTEWLHIKTILTSCLFKYPKMLHKYSQIQRIMISQTDRQTDRHTHTHTHTRHS